MKRLSLHRLLLCGVALGPAAPSRSASFTHSLRAYSVADAVVHAMLEEGVPRLPDVRSMPAGMQPFVDTSHASSSSSPSLDKEKTNNKTTVDVANAKAGAKPEDEELPPWPIDEIEYNARAPNGGHDLRRQEQQRLHTLSTSASQEEEESNNSHRESTSSSHTLEQADANACPFSVPRIVALSAARRAALATLAASDEGGRRQAVQCGGWVCGSCLAAMPYPTRSICAQCRTLRHDLASAPQAKAERTRRTNWICATCGEANRETQTVCQTCQGAQGAGQAHSPVQHEGVAAQVQHAALGTVVNLRNRIVRWRCAGCAETNSLQGSLCRRCTGERFALTLSCPTCGGGNELSNALAYGQTEEDRIHVEHSFGLHNCFARLAPSLTCAHCHGLLHGARVRLSGRTMWWCACGVCNLVTRASCMRCRLPRAGLSQDLLRTLLLPSPSSSSSSSPSSSSSSSPAPPRWDCRTCTTWFCESCDGVNRAARYVVVLRSSNNNNNNNTSKKECKSEIAPAKVARMLYGDDVCRHCGQPWHHVLLQQGLYWRCACHKVNQAADTTCQSCGLPALDTLRSPILSQWVVGDWLCARCGKQNYRDRVRCVCGALRPNVARHATTNISSNNSSAGGQAAAKT